MDGKFLKRYIQLGLLGGFIGTVAMDVVFFAELYHAKLSFITHYRVIGSAIGGNARVGLMAHFIVGPVLGLLFGAFISFFNALHIHDNKKGILLGLGMGFITIPLGCVPTALLSQVPILKFVGFSTLPHLVWGFVLGWVTAIGVKNLQSRGTIA